MNEAERVVGITWWFSMALREKDSDGYVKATAKDYEKYEDSPFFRPYEKECSYCGETFYAFYPLRKYCSRRCKRDAARERRKRRKEDARKKTCEYCGEEFNAERTDAKYCSSKCRVYAWRENEEE